jgi:hypothetical protein
VRWIGHVACTGEIRNPYIILVGNFKRSFARPRSRWEDNIRIDLCEIGWEGVDWSGGLL